MSDAYRGDRRDFLKKGAVAVGGLAALPYLAPGRAWGAGSGKGELGLVGIDHVGLTVPDIAEAVEWFQDVMGARAPLSFGPFSDPPGNVHA